MTNNKRSYTNGIPVVDYFMCGALGLSAVGFLALAVAATLHVAAPTVWSAGAWAAITGLGGAVIGAVVALLADLS
ncbi:MAG TPA: hypothetical protein VFV58_39435 [Blastocatellia bacterium]|jgi:hypothetical protein|nr:hypothetical protein [Blastocatellia bacterium]